MVQLRTIYLLSIICSFLLLNACGSGGGSGSDKNTTQVSSPDTINLSQAPLLTLESSYNTFGQTRGVLKASNIIYVADGSSGLIVLRSDSGNTLTKIATLSMINNGLAFSLIKTGNYLYMASREEGIYVIDISDPASPNLVNIIATPAEASYLAIEQTHLYLSAGTYLVILDISNPATPKITGELSVSTAPNQHLIVENGLAYIAAYTKGLIIVDVSNPSSPHILSQKSIGFTARGIFKRGDYVYFGGGGSGLYVYNVGDPGDPSFIGKIPLPGEIYDIVSWWNFLFIADSDGGIQLVDITTLYNPVLVNSFQSPGSSQSLMVDDLALTTANHIDGVHLYNIFETTDRDGDGVVDGEDSYPNDPTEWADTDGDSIGNNSDPDDDNDGYLDLNDDFPTNPLEWSDSDGDNVGDNSDIFPLDSLEWADSDNDGIGDNADIDDDNDGLADINDPFPTDPINLLSITINSFGNGYPKLDNDKIAWRGYLAGGKPTIFYKDLSDPNNKILGLADDIKGFIGIPSLSNGQVAWRVWDKDKTDTIYLWDGSSIRIITSYTTGSFGGEFGYPPSYHSIAVSLDNGQLAWAAWDGNDYEIYFWDGTSIRQITNNDVNDYEAQLSNGQIAWTGESLFGSSYDIYFWDGNNINNISGRPNTPDEDPHLMNGKIAWSGYNNSTYKRDIYFWDGRSTVVINLSGSDFEPQIDNSGTFITWHNVPETSTKYNIYLWDGYEVIMIPGIDDIAPYANNGKIAFSRRANGNSDIVIAEVRLDKDNDGVLNSIDPFPLDPTR